MGLHKREGYTLVEVIVALLILGILIVAFLNVFGGGLINIFTAGQQDQAMVEAGRIMERLYAEQESRDAQLNESPPGTPLNEPDIAAILDAIVLEENYALTYEIHHVQPLDEAEGFQVIVRVTSIGGQHSASLEAFIRGEAND